MVNISKPKIVIVQNFDLYPDQITRLKALGDATFYNDVPTDQEWLDRVKNADIVCSDFGDTKKNIYKTENKYYSLPFVNVGWLDKEKLKERNISVSNAPGCNKLAVSEWIIMMALVILRRFFEFANVTDLPDNQSPSIMVSLAGKKILILGKGHIGNTTGKIFESFSAKVDYFQKGDDLLRKSKNANIIINCLGANPSTQNILDRNYFMSLTPATFFITITSSDVYDREAMMEALDGGILAAVADDNANENVGCTNTEYYKKAGAHPKIIITPHIAFHTDVTARTANDMMIDNIEAWINQKPINLI